MKNPDKTWNSLKSPLGICGKQFYDLIYRGEKQIQKFLHIAEDYGIQLMGQCKNKMKICHWQKL